MKKVSYDAYVQEALRALKKGAFLTVKAEGEVNTMTIGWGDIGIVWSRPMFMVMVRHSRHTYQLIENADEFTVSFPLEGQLKEELNFCGTKSGRNVDKFAELGLEKLAGQKVEAPLIGGCDLHYECKIKYSQAMDPKQLDDEIADQLYPDSDYHTLYYGEIAGCYLTE